MTYGVNVIRRTNFGPYLGNWMIHANLKTAASRIGIFTDFRGSKGNFAESGLVSPYGISLHDQVSLEAFSGSQSGKPVYLMKPDGVTPAVTYFSEFKGRVQVGAKSMSIIHHSECVQPGSRFDFEFRFLRGDVKEADIIDLLALSMIVGLGSVKSLGNGKFRYTDVEILAAEKPRIKKPKDEKKKSSLPVKAIEERSEAIHV